jgi:octaprenyl-diphosphate synthase
MQRGSPDQRAIIKSAIENGSVDQLASVIDIVRQTGALEVSHQAAILEAQRAVEAARRLPAGPYTDGLIQLASELLTRQH